MVKNIQYYQRVILLLWLGLSAGELLAATDCNQVTEIPVSECQSLLELYNSTNGANWTRKTGWNQTNTPCSWAEVACSAGHIRTIILWHNKLVGTLPNLNLPNLQYLSLDSNQLTGSIPNFTNLPNLQYLSLDSNQLTGSIPNLNLPNLSELHLNNNQLSGSIPNFTNLPNLQKLWLFSNRLSGSIPDFTHLPKLRILWLKSNRLKGRIPNFTSFDLANLGVLFSNNCGLIPYDTAQEAVLNQKDPDWKPINPDCFRSVSLNKIGNGQISGNGTAFFAFDTFGITDTGSMVNLSATPDADSKFVGWSPSPCATSFQMPANDLTCTATFVLKEKYTFNLTKAEHGTVLAEGINCGADCNESYVENSVVSLTAMPETGYKLESWSGDCVGNSNSCQITMNGNKTVNASFSLIPSYPLTLQTSGDGLGSISGNGNYKVGETVNLTASPDANSVFVDWKPTPCNSSFEMPNNALTCIATFNKKGSTSSTTDLTFFQINQLYNVGEWLHARLKTQLNVASRFNRVDLWVAIQFPDKTMFFMTAIPTNPISTEPQAFKRSLEQMDAEIVVLDFEIPPNMGGDYIFYALYVETGKNPLTDGFTVFRSNIATITTTLRNH